VERIPGLDVNMSEPIDLPAASKPPMEEADTPVVILPSPPKRTVEQTARAARLASALRDNLRRRKAAPRPPTNSGN